MPQYIELIPDPTAATTVCTEPPTAAQKLHLLGGLPLLLQNLLYYHSLRHSGLTKISPPQVWPQIIKIFKVFGHQKTQEVLCCLNSASAFKLELRPRTSSPKPWPHHVVPALLDHFSPSFTASSFSHFLPIWLAPGSLPSLLCHLLHSPTCSHRSPTACAIQQRLLFQTSPWHCRLAWQHTSASLPYHDS